MRVFKLYIEYDSSFCKDTTTPKSSIATFNKTILSALNNSNGSYTIRLFQK